VPTVTYRNQPGIHKTRGAVPLAGTAHIYTATRVLWPKQVSAFLDGLLLGRTLHVCCGKSLLGDVLVDIHEEHAHLRIDAANMRDYIANREFETVLCDPPYNGRFRWNHGLLTELARVASQRIIFQHWFIPARADGKYKKDHSFQLTMLYVWQPRTYFGRVQVVSVFDREGSK
jgi:hypothetical protein